MTAGPLRFSLAGIQLKFSALMDRQGGLTIPAKGSGGNWIVKLPSPSYPQVPENEYTVLEWARRCGIEAPEARLVGVDTVEGLPDLGPFVGHNALALRRFDRLPDGCAVHMEDLAQVFGIYPENKYEQAGYVAIARLLHQLIGLEAALEFVRRLVFSILSGNGDMHLKNWSLLYPDGQHAVLSPAYDQLSTVLYLPEDRLALNLAGEKSFMRTTLDSFRRLAAKAELPEEATLATVRTTVSAAREAWEVWHRESPLDPALIRRINTHLHGLPLANAT